MKFLFFVMLTFLSFNITFSQTKAVFEKRTITKFTIKSTQLDSLLKDYIIKNEFEFQSKQSLILLNSYNKPEGFELKLISVEKKYFLNTVFPCLFSGDTLIGYSEIDNNFIFIFNKDLLEFFNKTEENKDFDFCVKLSQVKPASKKRLPNPPLNFEPLIYTYKYDKGKFTFIECSMVGYY